MTMKKYINNYFKLFVLLLAIGLTGCELDERIDDLTGGYEGYLIDKLSGDTVTTEYYGAKIMLLDLK